MNILTFELRKNLPSSLIWAISLGCFGFFCLSLFPVFTSDIVFFRNLLKAYPPEFMQALGAQLQFIETLTGFYSFCFLYILLCGAFEALYLGISVISKEIAGKSSDFLYTKPVSRWKILSYKLLSCMICLFTVNIIYNMITVYGAYAIGEDFDLSLFLTMNLGFFFTQLLFLCLGFCLGCIMKKIKSPLSITSGIICVCFLLQMIVNMEPDGFLSYVSFLNYTSGDIVLINQGFDMVYLCLSLSISLLFLIGGYLYFQKRDIHTQ